MKYIMMLTSGEYSDREDIAICYFDDRERAIEAIDKANIWLRKYGVHKQCEQVKGVDSDPASAILKAIWPHAFGEYWGICYAGADFYLEEVVSAETIATEIPDFAIERESV
jgi:hypothetical protein